MVRLVTSIPRTSLFGLTEVACWGTSEDMYPLVSVCGLGWVVHFRTSGDIYAVAPVCLFQPGLPVVVTPVTSIPLYHSVYVEGLVRGFLWWGPYPWVCLLMLTGVACCGTSGDGYPLVSVCVV